MNPSPRQNRFALRSPVWRGALLWLWLAAPLFAADLLLQERRAQAASNFHLFHFEPGGPALDNRDFDSNNFPDFWRPLVDDSHSAYLANAIKLVDDPQREGRYGYPGKVLRVPFDGTGVAIETRYPVVVDPEMAYVVSANARTERLTKSVVAITLQWLKITDSAENIVEENQLVVPSGQEDWSEAPLKIHIKRVPNGATHLRLVINIKPQRGYRSADRQGVAWFDDIAITTRPKIYMEPTFKDYTPGGSMSPPAFDFDIDYRGLTDNIPPAERQGAVAKSYYRTIAITDLNGAAPRDRRDRLLQFKFPRRREIVPGTLDNYPEKIPITLDKLGVYYLTVTLFGYRGELLTERTQVLGLWQPAKETNLSPDERATTDGFGVVIDEIPFAILQRDGVLAALVKRTGAQYVKVNLWPRSAFGEEIDAKFFSSSLAAELEKMRRAGLRVTAILEPPASLLGAQTLYDIMRDAPKLLATFIDTLVAVFDSQIENWQWGGDDNDAFSRGVSATDTAEARALLSGRVSYSAQSFPLGLNHAADAPSPDTVLPAPDIATAVSIFTPASYTENRLLRELIKLLPGNFTRFHEAWRRLYPPQWLLEASPIPEPSDEMRVVERKLEDWLTLELPATPAETHVPRAEREVLADMARKAVLARVADLPRIYIKSLLSPTNGLATIDQDNNPIPLPALLGLRVLDEYLTGASYLGSFNLLNQYGFFPNYVFALPNGQAIDVVWFDGKDRDEAELDFGGGYRLNIVDLQGNIRPLPANSRFIAGRTPQIITGMTIPYARTRLSINILREPTLLMQGEEQRQMLTITNFFKEPISGEITIDYAAKSTSFQYEENWRVTPPRSRFNIGRAIRNEPQTVLIPYAAFPPPTSTLDEGQETGEKIASLRVSLIGDHPETMRLLRPVILHSDLTFGLRMLATPDEQTTNVLQMTARWTPDEKLPHKAEILLRPFYRLGNELETLLPTVLMPAFRHGDNDTPPVNIEYNIPKNIPPNVPVWIGFRQEDGTRFLNYNINKLISDMRD